MNVRKMGTQPAPLHSSQPKAQAMLRNPVTAAALSSCLTQNAPQRNRDDEEVCISCGLLFARRAVEHAAVFVIADDTNWCDL